VGLGFRWMGLLVLLWRSVAAQPITSEPEPQQYVHEQWTVEDGLPVNAINEVIQSHDGYLWLATFDGLVRFDGVRFTVFNTGNSEGLPSNRIVDLLETRDGSLWMRTEQGHLVRCKEGVFTHFGHGPGGSVATVLYEDEGGTLWVGTDQGVVRYQDGQLVPVAEGALTGAVMRLLRDRAGALWVGTADDGLQRWAEGDVTRWTTDDGLATNKVRAFYEDRAGTLWLSSNEGINAYRKGTLSRLQVDGIPWQGQGNIWNLYADLAPDSFWIGTSEKLYHYQAGRITPFDPEGGQRGTPSRVQRGPEGRLWIALGHRLYREEHLVFEAGSKISAFVHDVEGSLWVATQSSGLSRLKPSLFTVYSEAEGLVHKNVYPIYEDHTGALWFGTFGGGMSRFYRGVFTGYMTGIIYSIHEDRQDNLWVGFYEGVCRFDGETCVPVEEANGFIRGTVKAIYDDEEGTMWFGTSDGLVRYREGVWVRYTTQDGLPSNDVRYLLEAQNGALWFGTNGGGLGRYHNGVFTALTTDDGLSSNLVRSIYQDEDGILWVGTEGRGLNRLDLSHSTVPEGAHITAFRRKDGLFDEVIHQILEDDFGRLWMSTNRGIFWVERAELNAFAEGTTTRVHSTSYTERDGLRHREANGGIQPAGIKARDGRLWFPTQDGAVVVDPSDIRRNETPPPVVIEQVVVGDTVISHPGTQIQLSAQNRNFEIVYTALSFVAPENMRFQYRLEGLHREWVQASGRRVAYYTNVPPGTYTFRVIASNNDGVWNEEGASLTLQIAPYFYETTWFLGLCVLLFLSAGPSLYVLRVRRLKGQQQELSRLVEARTAEVVQREAQLEAQNVQLEAQAAKLKELDELKSRFFANISHEFRTPLTLTIGPLEDLRTGVYGPLSRTLDEQLGLALRNARRLLRLVNQILDVAKLEAGQTQLRAQKADFIDFLVGIAQAFAPLAERKQITFRMEMPDAPVVAYFDPDLLEKVFVNLLSNAFKFTPRGGAVQLTAHRAEAAQAEAAIRRRNSRTSLTAFTRWTSRSDDSSRGPASGCRWRRNWSNCTAVRSASRARWISARRSRFGYRWGRHTLMPARSWRLEQPHRGQARSRGRLCTPKRWGAYRRLRPPTNTLNPWRTLM